MTLRIAYFGLPLGALLLRADGHEFAFCALSPIEAPGLRRVRGLGDFAVYEAAELGAEFEACVDSALLREQPNLLVSWFWTRRLPERWLSAPRLGAIGVHPSLLPRHRGPNPFFWAIDCGDVVTGVSVHNLEVEYDTGGVLEQESIEVGEMNAWQLARALDRPSLRALRRTVRRFASGQRPAATPQDEARATLSPEPTGDLLRVDFAWTTERILRRVRALSPTPGLALELAGLPFFVTRAAATQEFLSSLEPGEAQIAGQRLVLRTSDGALTVERALLEGEGEDAEELDGSELALRAQGRLTSRSTEARAFAWNGDPE